MAKKGAIGFMQCPECGHADAEIKEDKNGHPYRYCPDCSAQYMTHGRPHKVENLKARMRKVEPEPVHVPEGVPEPVQVEKPKRAMLMGGRA